MIERYEALYEQELYREKGVPMWAVEHERLARRKVYEAIIAECSAPQYRVPEGWKLVPLEPTWQMWDRAENEYVCFADRSDEKHRKHADFDYPTHRIARLVHVYKEMVKMAPAPTYDTTGQVPVAWRWRWKHHSGWRHTGAQPYESELIDVEPLYAKA